VFHVKRENRLLGAGLSRRATISLVAWFVRGSLCAPALATPEIKPQDNSLAGQLLIATPAMGDPRFANTVILMVRHGKDGAMGVTINRPVGERPLAALIQAIGEDASGVSGTVRIFAGGPVQSDAGFILHDAAYRRIGTIDIDGRLAMTSNPQILLDIGQHAGPRQYLVAFGYAGWAPLQLEGELAERAWITTPEDPELVFDADRATVWDLAKARAKRGL
jgi:putative transcriptional regulator